MDILTYYILLFVTFCLQFACATESPTQIIVDTLKRVNYDKFNPPLKEGEGPVVVTFGIYVETMSSPKPTSMDYELGCYIRTQWQDPRLQYNASGIDQIRINDLSMFEKIWQPDIYFPNVKEIRFQTGLIPNFIARVYPNGTIFSSKRYLLLAECPMQLSKYPMDKQICSLRLLSWASKDYQVLYEFFETPVEVNPEMAETEMNFVAFSSHEAPKRFERGVYSGLRIDFELHRKLGHHLIQTFLPTALVVCLSWASFWFDMQAIQARLSICILTLLILSTQSSGLRQILPPVSYVKAIDVWIGFCMTMDCLVLLEFSYVNFLARKWRMNPTKADGKNGMVEENLLKIERENAGIPQVSTPDISDHPRNHNRREIFHHSDLEGNIRFGEMIDRISRYLFPAIFTVFNLFFWIFYSIF